MIKAILKLFLIKPWQRYILCSDGLGLTLENKRSCAPRLSESENEASTSEPTVCQDAISNKKSASL
jgi:hypothetical protein